jgi:hypothetical protein
MSDFMGFWPISMTNSKTPRENISIAGVCRWYSMVCSHVNLPVITAEQRRFQGMKS